MLVFFGGRLLKKTNENRAIYSSVQTKKTSHDNSRNQQDEKNEINTMKKMK